MIHPTPSQARRARERAERLASYLPAEDSEVPSMERVMECADAHAKAYAVLKLLGASDLDVWDQAWRDVTAAKAALRDAVTLYAAHKAGQAPW